MFQDNLFSIVSKSQSDSQADFIVRLNDQHPIYTGHFPEEAITPGVCIIQMAVDLFSHTLQQIYHLVKAKNVKFLQIIRPDEHETVCYQISWEPLEDQAYAIKAVVGNGDTVFTKMSIQLGKA